jgi:outer membrane lipoprotein-sorting protein
MRTLLAILSLVTFTACTAQAQPRPQTQATAPSPAIAEMLETLYRRGLDLQDFTADVTLSESDALGSETEQFGKVWFQRKQGGDARIRVGFDRKKLSGRVIKQRREYLLDNGKLVDQNFESKQQVTRQVLKPGQKLDPLKLGEGPFPLPIGQPPADVLKNFAVALPPAGKEDPPNTTHLSLKPLPGTRFARKFSTIEVYVDKKSNFPARIETADKDGVTVRTTELANLKINAGLKDADFKLPEPTKDWNVLDEDLGE